MTWEETIRFIRTKPEFKQLVELAYFEEELCLNVERFKKSREFIETLSLLKQYQPLAKKILDIGSGNGISTIAFALEGYQVTSIEPDKSETIGAGAISQLKEYYHLENVQVLSEYAEDIQFQEGSFDIVYSRQCMHHAYNLEKFVFEAGRVLKPGGLFITVRDHVVFDKKDKAVFLNAHPLQKFYGGENAFTPDQYKNAIFKAGLKLVKELKFYDSVINYFPLVVEVNEENIQKEKERLINHLKSKISYFANLKLVQNYYLARTTKNINEKSIAGRMYSFIALKSKKVNI